MNHAGDGVPSKDASLGSDDVLGAKQCVSPNRNNQGELASSTTNKTLLVIKAALQFGQRKDGVQLAPKQLAAFCLDPFTKRRHVVDPELAKLAEQHRHSNSETCSRYIFLQDTSEHEMYQAEAVGRANERLHFEIYSNVMKSVQRGVLPNVVTLGGDHSIAMGSVSAVSRAVREAFAAGLCRSPDLVVFWIDAHADINTPETSQSGNLHGCPVSLLANIDREAWSRTGTHFDWIWKASSKPLLSLSRLAYIGLRDVDEAEHKILEENAVLQFPMARIKAARRNMSQIIQTCLGHVDPEGIRPIHISFDIDSIDPSFAPSTGTPVPDGLFPEEGMEIIKLLGSTGRLLSFDLVEVNPSLGTTEDAQKTVDLAGSLIKQFFASCR